MDQDSNILDALDFEPEDELAFRLAALHVSNRALVQTASIDDVGELYILAGLDAIKNAICGTDKMSDERIAIELAHESAFEAALLVLQSQQHKNPDDGRADD